MNFLNIFEDHVAGIFGATRAPFSFKKLAKQAARDMDCLLYTSPSPRDTR